MSGRENKLSVTERAIPRSIPLLPDSVNKALGILNCVNTVQQLTGVTLLEQRADIDAEKVKAAKLTVSKAFTVKGKDFNVNATNGLAINTATSGSPVSIGHTTSVTTVNAKLNVTGNLDVAGVANLDDTDIDGTFEMDGTSFVVAVEDGGTVTIDNADTTNGVKINTAKEGGTVTIGNETSSVTTIGHNLTVKGTLKLEGNHIIFSDGAEEKWYKVTISQTALDTLRDAPNDSIGIIAKGFNVGHFVTETVLIVTPTTVDMGAVTIEIGTETNCEFNGTGGTGVTGAAAIANTSFKPNSRYGLPNAANAFSATNNSICLAAAKATKGGAAGQIVAYVKVISIPDNPGLP